MTLYRGFLTPSRIFLSSLLAWLAGVALPIVPHSPGIYLATGLLVLVFLFRRFLALWVSLLLVAVFFTGSSYEQWYLKRITPTVSYGTQQTFDLTIFEKPIKYQTQVRYVAQTTDGWYAYLILPTVASIEAGTKVRVEGSFQPASYESDLQYRLALAKKHIFAKVQYPTILSRSSAPLNPWQRLLIGSRQQFEQVIDRLFVEPQGALLSGILTGAREDLPRELSQAFAIAGLTHLLAVSGYNITVLMELWSRATRRFGRFTHFLLSLAIISFFIFFTGASASVVRAGILASLFALAYFIGRKASVLRLLIVTATLMTIVNPLTLRYDIGFQLSFAAVVGLVVLAEPLETLLRRARLPEVAAAIIAATTAAQIATLPIIAHYFATASPYALLANLLVGPVIPFLTGGGMVLVVLGSISAPLVQLVSPIFDIILRYIATIATLVARLPAASLTLPAIPKVVWFCYYAAFASLLWLAPKKENIW